ncbi:Sleepless protein [Popillia japonica]|uniref:Sleepless protein n=1 Tax=Popillia japonica TaxID=7064 RepID=A0AAW1NM41_POPJA
MVNQFLLTDEITVTTDDFLLCQEEEAKGDTKMKISELYLVELILVLVQFYTANAIKCFQCDYSKPGCADLTPKNTSSQYYKECTPINGTAFCRKTRQSLLFREDIVRITRECGWITHKSNENRCFKYDTQHKFDTSCQCFEDGCNSAFTLSIPTYLMSATTAAIAALYRIF